MGAVAGPAQAAAGGTLRVLSATAVEYKAATGKTNREGGEIPDHQVLAQTLAVGPGWFISIEGGIPLTIEGQCIAAVGVSGAPAAVDKQICQAGVDAFNKAA